MIVPDVNLLVFAYNDQSAFHREAKTWWEDCLNGTVPVGIPWVSISGFLRLMTHPRVLERPMTVPAAVSCVRQWLDQPPVRILHPGARFPEVFFQWILQIGTGGNLITDVSLAAMATEYQAELHSADSDFDRFPGLRWRNPLRRSQKN